MKLSNQLLLPEVSGAKTIDELKVVIQKLTDTVREFHRYVWNDLNSGIVTIPPGSVGGGGTADKMTKWHDSYQLEDATNTDTEVAAAVTLKHANSKDHDQNTDLGTSSSSFFFGSATVDGSWQVSISGTDLIISRREGGNWVEKGRYTA